jgi:hypothetical protein
MRIITLIGVAAAVILVIIGLFIWFAPCFSGCCHFSWRTMRCNDCMADCGLDWDAYMGNQATDLRPIILPSEIHIKQGDMESIRVSIYNNGTSAYFRLRIPRCLDGIGSIRTEQTPQIIKQGKESKVMVNISTQDETRQNLPIGTYICELVVETSPEKSGDYVEKERIQFLLRITN